MEGSGPSREFSFALNTSAARSGLDTRDYDTPREGDDAGSPLAVGLNLPASPNSVRKKTKSRAGKALSRNDSLKESKASCLNMGSLCYFFIYFLFSTVLTKIYSFFINLLQVLMVTGMRRSESVIQPDLFQYHNHFEFLGLIGKTKVSEVFRVRHRQTKEIFAVKRSRRGFRTKLQRERCLREIKAVSALPSHPNIVGQYRAWQEGGHFYIQMDYCEGGSLNQVIYPASGPSPLTTEQLWTVATQVASGLDFLHSHDVLHLDIKPENLYRNLDNDGDPGPWRIGDFGLAVAKETKDWEEGDGDYVAPELLRNCEQPTPAADIFSLGATLYECATGEKLPRRESSADAAEIDLPDRPESFVTMLRAMLLTNPAERPLAGQIVAYATAFYELEVQNGDVATMTSETGPQQGKFSFAALSAGAGTTPSPLLVHPAAAAAADINNSDSNPNNNTGEAPLRWVPSLSPLLSDGNLTPGAAAGLIGLTPPTAGAPATTAGASNQQQTNNNMNNISSNGSPNPVGFGGAPPRPRPPPLSLPPHQITSSSHQHPLSTNRTLENSNPNSFRIHRRDLISPGRNGGGSELMESATESEPYSFSCDCDTGSASDLDFPDTVTAAAGGGGNGGGGNLNGVNSGIPLPNSRRLSGMSLAWEMYTSPDWQSRRPPSRSSTPPVKYPGGGSGGDVSGSGNGRPASASPGQADIDEDELQNPNSNPSSAPNSLESSPSNSRPVSSRSCAAPGGITNVPAVPRFPPLDGLGLNLMSHHIEDQLLGPLSARDRISARNTPRYPSPFESSAHAAAAAAAVVGAAAANMAAATPGSMAPLGPPPPKTKPTGSGFVVPPLVLPSLNNNNNKNNSSLRRKRQHSSRRPLVQALKENGDLASARSVDLCSSRSLQELMPVRKGARRGGTFHPDGPEIDLIPDGTMNDINYCTTGHMVGCDEAQPISGHSTQRSARGPPSARLGDLSLSATAGIGGAPCSAAAAADRMNTMTLNDTKNAR